jgi:hypothetical protein
MLKDPELFDITDEAKFMINRIKFLKEDKVNSI